MTEAMSAFGPVREIVRAALIAAVCWPLWLATFGLAGGFLWLADRTLGQPRQSAPMGSFDA